MLAVEQLGFHYSLHFTPWIALGLVAFGWSIWSAPWPRARIPATAALAVYLLCNAAFGLAPGDLLGATPLASPTHLRRTTWVTETRASPALRGLFTARFPPARREDYDEIARLVAYLRAESSDSDPIYVAASSHTLSDDLLWHADRTLHEEVMASASHEFWQSRHLNLLHWVPFADSSGYYPLEKLLQSHYVVIATPFQRNLRPEEHDVIRVVHTMFTEQWAFADDFTRLPEQFSLSDGAAVSVYRRARPTSLETAVSSLRDMQAFIGERPGGQLNWIGLNAASGSYVSKSSGTTYRIDTSLDPAPAARSFVYLDGFTDQTVVSGALQVRDAGCGGIALRLDALDAGGAVVDTALLTHQPADAPGFSLPVPAAGAVYLLLTLSGIDDGQALPQPCPVGVLDLVVSAPNPRE